MHLIILIAIILCCTAAYPAREMPNETTKASLKVKVKAPMTRSKLKRERAGTWVWINGVLKDVEKLPKKQVVDLKTGRS
jgi:hypothetical protein